MDLFEYQSIPQGGWVVLDVSECAVLPGVTRPGVAGCAWTTVAVGFHLGSQLGYPATHELAGIKPSGGGRRDHLLRPGRAAQFRDLRGAATGRVR